ncbi:hypothetical protein C8R46DRAFT_1252933 [Mycena filopes]|nr:hypothetical protein C8R46DRAFT_1252933 [Mycena filopes]
MHSSLRLSKLGKLPFAFKQVALAAANSRRTFDDLRNLFLVVSEIPENLHSCVLPVFYATLDPSAIPMLLDTLDTPAFAEDAETLRLQIGQIDISLLAIATMASVEDIPLPALLELWPRIWHWVEFRDTYGDHLPTVDLPFTTPPSRYATYMKIFRWFGGTASVADAIKATPGVYTVVGRAWAYLIHEPDDKGFEDCSNYLGQWFRSRDWPHEVFEELVFGAGGRQRLASVLLAHLKRVVPTPDHDVDADCARTLIGPVYLLRQIMAGDWDVPFRDTLLGQDIITALTTVSCAVGASTHPIAMIEIKGFLASLVSGLACSPTHPRITESLQAGLLPAVFSCGSNSDEETDGYLVELLRDILPGATVYHSVLRQLEVSLSQVRDVKIEEIVVSPTVIEQWHDFLALAEKRVEMMRQFDAGALAATRTCGNLICGRLDLTNEFKRCSNCRTSQYCSPECQVDDWRRGGHRQNCNKIASRRWKTSYLNALDRSFMCALVTHDYAARQPELALEELQWMHAHPGEVPYMLLDYEDGTLEVTFNSHREAPGAFAAELTASCARPGRRLHLVSIPDGDEDIMCVVQLIAEGVGLAGELRLLADGITPGTESEEMGPVYQVKVRGLLSI